MIRPEDEQKVKENYYKSVIDRHAEGIDACISQMLAKEKTFGEYYDCGGEGDAVIDKLVEHIISNGWYAKKKNELMCGEYGKNWVKFIVISKYPIKEDPIPSELDPENLNWFDKLLNLLFY